MVLFLCARQVRSRAKSMSLKGNAMVGGETSLAGLRVPHAR